MNKAAAARTGAEAGRPTPTVRIDWGRWLTWTAGFIAFPIAGLVGRGVVGRVDDMDRGQRRGHGGWPGRWGSGCGLCDGRR